MDARQCFKTAFLLEASAAGLGIEQMLEKAEMCLQQAPAVKQALFGEAATLGLVAGVGAPIGAGMIGGNLLAKAQEDDTDVDEAKANELLDTYQRLTEEAKARAARKAMAKPYTPQRRLF